VSRREAGAGSERVIEAHKVTSMSLEMLLRGEIEWHAIEEEPRPGHDAKGPAAKSKE